MTITLKQLAFLSSPSGEQLLETLANDDLSEANRLRLLTRLRRQYAPDDAAAALTLAMLRQQAVGKFGEDAGRLFFTPDALEQASDPLVRAYRARAAAGRSVVDAGCGIGADSLAMAQAGGEVLGLDLDPVRVAMARLNAAALDVAARFEVADIRAGLPDSELAFFDPARRDANGRRLHHVEQYEPPLSTIRRWKQALIVVKLSPGVALDQLAGYTGLVEFISVDGALKEATLWLGAGQGLKATLLTEDGALHWQNADPARATLSEPRAWLIEPDPALLRAGLVGDLAVALGGAQLDETIAYITAETWNGTPWARAWKVLDWMPFNVKRLRAYLRERRVGRVTVKKRGSAVTPEALVPQLKLKGGNAVTLALTRCRGQQIVIVCEEQPTPGQSDCCAPAPGTTPRQ